MGPKGNSLKRLQEETKCLVKIVGRGSMKDPAKEAELLEMNDPKYAHLNDDLHVEISAYARPAEAYARMAHALSEVMIYFFFILICKDSIIFFTYVYKFMLQIGYYHAKIMFIIKLPTDEKLKFVCTNY